MKTSKLALNVLLGGALIAFGCSDGSSRAGTGGNGGSGGSAGDGGTGGGDSVVQCVDDGSSCMNSSIDPIVPCCTPTAPPEQEDACSGDEILENPTSCDPTGNEVLHQLTVIEVFGDCNGGYDLDGCDGSTCEKQGLVPGEGELGVDNALAGVGGELAIAGGNLGNVNQALADAICGMTDADGNPETGENGCEAMATELDLKLNVDANVEQSCATVDLIAGETELSTVILNISDPTEAGTVCASGTLGTIPLQIAGASEGTLRNTVVRMTVSENGFTDGVLGATIDSETAGSITDEVLPGAGSAVAQVLDIDDELVQDNSVLCDALSSTFSIEGSAITAPQ